MAAGHVVLLGASLPVVQVKFESMLVSGLMVDDGRYQYPMLIPAVVVLVVAFLWLLVSTLLGWNSNKAKLS